ncbi:MAG TPA: Lrp/AsnC family transcriptional regulator [Conexibacter sp.]|nr:Lrp/AsnC family transcriptional regulator [Conexibacter sp.]
MPGTVAVDDVDLALLELLRADGRRTVADLARAVNLSPAPVGRRIARLERQGVIAGYTALVNESKLGRGVEAFAEVRVRGDVDIAAVLELAASMPEAQEAFTVAGDPDALVRLVVADAEGLRRAINTLRHSDGVVSTRTLLVLGSWRRRPGAV